MKDKIFLDTNIIVYAHDRSSGDKHDAAREIMEYLWESRRGVISVQILQEFYVCVTQKIAQPLLIKKAREICEYLSTWDVVDNVKYITLKAIDLQEKYRFSFWDSLVVQAAIQGGASVLLSEDLPDDQLVEGVRIVNPFQRDWKGS
jgi:predicted nucleic acid-binding protein